MPPPSSDTAPPMFLCVFSVACSRSTSVVFPEKVSPTVGAMCHSAAAGETAAARQRQLTASARHIGGPFTLSGRQLQEDRREQRARDVAGAELVRSAEAVAIGEQDEREVAPGDLQHERRIGI